MTVIHFVSFIIKVILFIVLLPFFLIWAYLRYRVFRFTFIRASKNAGMPYDFARELAGEMNISRMFNGRKLG